MKSKVLLLLSITLAAIVLSLFIAVIVLAVNKQKYQQHSTTTCQTEDCKKLSAKMFLVMNTSANPCEDFEEFACGNYRNLRFSPNEFIDQFSDFSKTNKEMITEMLASDTEIIAKSKNLQGLFNLAKSAYKICRNVYSPSSNTTEIFNQLESYLQNKFFCGSLPSTVESYMIKLFSVVEPTFIYLHEKSRNGSYLTLSVSIHIDLDEMTSFLKSLHAKQLFLDWVRNASNFLHKMGGDEKFKEDFESDNSTCTFTSDELSKIVASYNLQGSGELMKLLSIKNVTFVLSQCNSIYSIVESYRENPGLLTSLLTMAIINDNYRDLFSSPHEVNAVEFCADILTKTFNPVVIEMFKDAYYPFVRWQELGKRFGKVTWAAVKSVNEQDWLDDEAKKQLSDSLNSIKVTIGLDDYMRKAALHALLTLNFTSLDDDSFAHILLTVFDTWTHSRSKSMKDHETISAYFSDIFQRRTALVFNAYNNNKFEIYMPYGFFNSFISSPGYPEYIKLAAFGSIAAHELGHNFPCTESLLGSEKNNKTFTEKCECVIKLYQREIMKLHAVNSSLALEISKIQINENIADVIGESVSWKAAFESSYGHEQTLQRLPGQLSSYTPQQVFAIHRAQLWCSKFIFERLRVPHANNRLRVNVVAKNSKYVANAFNCKFTDSMVMPNNEKCFVF